MIRDIISNDSLTLILFGSFFFIIILKKFDPNIFYQNLNFLKKESRNSLSNNLLGIKFIEIIYNILFVSNLSIILTFFNNQAFSLIVFLEYFKILIVFFVLKILIEIIISKLFSLNKLIKNYIWLKIVFANSLGLILLLFNFLITYSSLYNHDLTIVLISLTLVYSIFSYLSIFFSMKKMIFKNWFYFILYLCTLEIIPYYYLISNVL